jgi:hypothetical protein
MLFSGQAARAQTAGSTSGPAAGSPVTPNTAVQKENPANPASAEQAKEGVSPGAAVSAGSPGATAKEGTQGGPAPGSGVAQTTGGVSPGGAIGGSAGIDGETRDTERTRSQSGAIEVGAPQSSAVSAARAPRLASRKCTTRRRPSDPCWRLRRCLCACCACSRQRRPSLTSALSMRARAASRRRSFCLPALDLQPHSRRVFVNSTPPSSSAAGSADLHCWSG